MTSFILLLFPISSTSGACFEGFWLNYISHWLGHRQTLLILLFSFTEVVTDQLTTENNKVSYAKSFTFDSTLCDKSLICIKNK